MLKRAKKNENPIPRQRGRNGRVRDFADTERDKRNTKNKKQKHRYGQCYIAREKAEYKTVAEDEVYDLGQYGDGEGDTITRSQDIDIGWFDTLRGQHRVSSVQCRVSSAAWFRGTSFWSGRSVRVVYLTTVDNSIPWYMCDILSFPGCIMVGTSTSASASIKTSPLYEAIHYTHTPVGMYVHMMNEQRWSCHLLNFKTPPA